MNSDADTRQVALGGWVAPFGDPGINDRSHLPRAFRSVPRPSSPLSAKASTRCPYFALERHTQRQEPRGPTLRSNVAGRVNSPAKAGGHRCGKLSFSEDTSSRDTHTPPLGRARSPATVTQLASSRLSINKRLRSPRGAEGNLGSSRRVAADKIRF